MNTRNRFAGAQATAPVLSVVLPAFREGAGIAQAIAMLETTLSALNMAFEVVVVDDGSPDDTYDQLARLCARRPWLRGLRLSRNFGKESALLAGLTAARGAAVITMDADLQHPPALIPAMVDAWRNGAKVVNAVKTDRGACDSRWYASAADLVTGMLTRWTGISLKSASDFKLLDRQVVEVLVNSLPERERFYRGLSQWAGFERVDIPFSVAAGTRNDRNWTFRSLARLATTALVSFTSAPLQIITVLGGITLLFAVATGTDALLSWARGDAVSGFTTLILTLLILGSFMMISLGVLGLYVAKIYEEIKQRPAYVIAERCGVRTKPSTSAIARTLVARAKGPEMIDQEIPEKNYARHTKLRRKIRPAEAVNK